MVFKKRAELGGEIDQHINTYGRGVRGEKSLTNLEIRNKELMSLLRKFKPHLAKAVEVNAKIMGAEDSSDTNKIKSSALIISVYKDLINSVYDKDYDEQEGDEVQPNSKATVFSLTMVKNNEEIGQS